MKGIGSVVGQYHMRTFAYQRIIFVLFSWLTALLLSSYGKYH